MPQTCLIWLLGPSDFFPDFALSLPLCFSGGGCTFPGSSLLRSCAPGRPFPTLSLCFPPNLCVYFAVVFLAPGNIDFETTFLMFAFEAGTFSPKSCCDYTAGEVRFPGHPQAEVLAQTQPGSHPGGRRGRVMPGTCPHAWGPPCSPRHDC